MQYASLQKDLTFLALFEAQYTLLLAKDWIKTIQAANQQAQPVLPAQIFEHKNVFKLRERFNFTHANFLDIRLNLQLGYSTLLNVSNEVLERPFVTYYTSRSDESGGILQIIDKYEMVNYNPYMIVLEDRSVINIYSYLEQEKHYRYKLNDCKFD